MSRPLIDYRFDVRWGDMDAFGHVNNARFHGYIEEARLQWLQGLPEPWVSAESGPLLASVTMNFRRPLGWPAAVVATLSVERIGNSSLTLAHRLRCATDSERLYADGSAVMVWVDRRSGRPGSLPAVVRNAAEQAATQG